VWRRGDAVLYVGLATLGIARPLGRHHRLLTEEIEDADTLEVFLFDTPEEAIAAEADMITALRPSLNGLNDGTAREATLHTRLMDANDDLRFENEILRYKVDTLERSMNVLAERMHRPPAVKRIACAALARLKPDRVTRQLRRLHSEFV
jgi:hypothetical protein